MRVHQIRSERKQLPWWFRRGPAYTAADPKIGTRSLQTLSLSMVQANRATDSRLIESEAVVNTLVPSDAKIPAVRCSLVQFGEKRRFCKLHSTVYLCTLLKPRGRFDSLHPLQFPSDPFQRLRSLTAAGCLPPVVVVVPIVRPVPSRTVTLDPVGCTVLVVRPWASRKVTPLLNGEAVRCVRPEASWKIVVWPLEVVAVQSVRPAESRKTVRLPSFVALPVVRPRLSLKVVRLPVMLAVPTIRPEASRNVVAPLDAGFVAT